MILDTRAWLSGLILALNLALLPARAQAGAAFLFLAEHTSETGESAVLPLTLYSTDPGIAAIQFDIEYDSSMLKVEMRGASALEKISKDLQSAVLSPNATRFLISGLNQDVIPDGVLGELVITPQPGACATPCSIRLVGGAAVDAEGTEARVTTRDGSITARTSGPLRIDRVANAASFSPRAIAAGEFVSLLGAGIAADAAVSVNGIPAPVLFAEATQINAIVPFAVGQDGVGRIEVSAAENRAATYAPVAASAPGSLRNLQGGRGREPFSIRTCRSTLPKIRRSLAVLWPYMSQVWDKPTLPERMDASTIPLPPSRCSRFERKSAGIPPR